MTIGSVAIAQALDLISNAPSAEVISAEFNFSKAQAAANLSLAETAASIGSERDAKRYALRAARYGACAELLETAYYAKSAASSSICNWQDFCRKDAK